MSHELRRTIFQLALGIRLLPIALTILSFENRHHLPVFEQWIEESLTDIKQEDEKKTALSMSEQDTYDIQGNVRRGFF